MQTWLSPVSSYILKTRPSLDVRELYPRAASRVGSLSRAVPNASGILTVKPLMLWKSLFLSKCFRCKNGPIHRLSQARSCHLKSLIRRWGMLICSFAFMSDEVESESSRPCLPDQWGCDRHLNRRVPLLLIMMIPHSSYQSPRESCHGHSIQIGVSVESPWYEGISTCS